MSTFKLISSLLEVQDSATKAKLVDALLDRLSAVEDDLDDIVSDSEGRADVVEKAKEMFDHAYAELEDDFSDLLDDERLELSTSGAEELFNSLKPLVFAKFKQKYHV